MRIELSCRLAGSVGGRDAPNVRGAPLPSIDSLTGGKQRPTLRLKVMDDGALQLRGDLDLIRVVDGNGHPFDFAVGAPCCYAVAVDLGISRSAIAVTSELNSSP